MYGNDVIQLSFTSTEPVQETLLADCAQRDLLKCIKKPDAAHVRVQDTSIR